MLNSAFDDLRRRLARLLSGAVAPGNRCAERRRLRDTSTTASTRPASRRARRLTRRRSARSSIRSTSSTQRLDEQRFLLGDRLTEADWRLFTTLVRFDAIYYGHFKCNRRRIAEYPNLSGYLRDLFQMPGVKDTVDYRARQAALLLQPRPHQSDAHRAARAAPDHRCPPRPRPLPWHRHAAALMRAYQSAAGASPASTSRRRALVPWLVSTGSASSGKSSKAAISILGMLAAPRRSHRRQTKSAT